MMNRMSFLSVMSAVLLVASLIFPTGQASAASSEEPLQFPPEALEALESSVYVDTQSRTAHIDQEKALELYSFTDEEFTLIQERLDQLSDDQIQEMINYATPDSGDISTQVAPAIIWGGIAVIGIFTGAALYFSSKYMTHQEKQNLINRCYDMGGSPSIDSGDVGGMGGEPQKAWWKMSNEYSFECVQ
ncbi:hypothetical protein NSQ54_05440 [Alkalihalobacillus sp. FSL W8-0930]